MQFHAMDDMTVADYEVLKAVHEENLAQLPDLLLEMLTKLGGDGHTQSTDSPTACRLQLVRCAMGEMRSTSSSHSCMTSGRLWAHSITVT